MNTMVKIRLSIHQLLYIHMQSNDVQKVVWFKKIQYFQDDGKYKQEVKMPIPVALSG